MTLVLPQARTRNGVGQTTKDLSEHPWAGVDVVLTLLAHDEGGNEGRSEPIDMRLPERPFGKPLARALIEQRRDLALDADAKTRVLTALDALAHRAGKVHARSRHLSRAALDLLAAHARENRRRLARCGRRGCGRWPCSSRTAMSPTRKPPCAPRRKRLRQALERGASDEEIKKLTDELRAALDKFMQALGRGDAEKSAALGASDGSEYARCCVRKTSRA